MTNTARVERTILGLYPGQRLWFWCSPGAPRPHPPLFITTLLNDPDMAQLRSEVTAVPLPPGAAFSMGVGYVCEDGTIKLGGKLVSAEMLAPIANWACDHVSAHPGLAGLRDLKMMTIRKGQVTAVHSEDALWVDMPQTNAPGTMGNTAERLSVLEQNHWFALLEAGEHSPPRLMIHPQESDPEGNVFSSWLLNTLAQSDSARTITGLLQAREDWLAMTTGDDISGWKTLLESVLSHWADLPGLVRLRTVRMVRLVDNQIAHIEAFGSPAIP